MHVVCVRDMQRTPSMAQGRHSVCVRDPVSFHIRFQNTESEALHFMHRIVLW